MNPYLRTMAAAVVAADVNPNPNPNPKDEVLVSGYLYA
jgi:hypothetical protein